MHPILLKIGGFELHTYALTMALGFIAAILLANRRIEQRGIDLDKVLNLEVVLILAGLGGARLMYCILEWREFVDHPLDIPLFWKGGLVYYGGFVAALVLCLAYCWKVGLPMLACSDVAAPSLATGQFFGRLGCLFGGCCYGAPCTLPWAMTFPATSGDMLPRHPTQAYEMLALLAIFAILTWYYNRPGRADGLVMVWYGYLYGVARFLIEYVRDDDRGGVFLGHFSISQVVSLGVIAGAMVAHLLLLAYHRRRAAKA